MRDEARAASYHADTADAEYRKLFDVSEKLAKALAPRLQPFASRLDGLQWCTECSSLLGEGVGTHREECPYAALDAWKPYRPVWEVTG